jgi:hypothetical protein
MDRLVFSPFLLEDGDDVVVRVAAQAVGGTGPFSVVNSNGAIMMSPPSALLTAPWLVVKTPISVTI